MKLFSKSCLLAIVLAFAGSNSLRARSYRSPIVVIDAGHGGRDAGAVAGHGRGRLMEKRITLALANRVVSELRAQGVEVVMTRTSDRYVGLEERAAKANACHAALFVSIHCDSNPDPSQRGFSILVPSAAGSGASGAARMLSRMMVAQGLRSHGSGSGVRRDDRGLLVLRKTASPAILVEAGFLTNRSEGLQLSQAGQEGRIARGIAEGIVLYLRH